jgi:hypothetical protein
MAHRYDVSCFILVRILKKKIVIKILSLIPGHERALSHTGFLAEILPSRYLLALRNRAHRERFPQPHPANSP